MLSFYICCIASAAKLTFISELKIAFNFIVINVFGFVVSVAECNLTAESMISFLFHIISLKWSLKSIAYVLRFF